MGLGLGSGVVLNLEVWECATHVTFNKCRNIILISFLPPKFLGRREKCGSSVPARSPSTTPLGLGIVLLRLRYV